MLQLTSAGQQALNDIAQRHGFSLDAVQSMLTSVVNGNGSMAQFSHPEFGGSGQWMQGGMTMIGDMFNNQLKGRVDNLCTELSRLIGDPPRAGSLFVAAPAQADWWGPNLRWPTTSGGQNNMRYAWFAQAHRLAIDVNGQVTIYDTLDHQISGVSQQQSGGSSLTFSSQYGYVNLSQLPVVSVDGMAPTPASPSDHNRPTNQPETSSNTSQEGQGAIFDSIEKLAILQARGILSPEEFATKKAELLSRL